MRAFHVGHVRFCAFWALFIIFGQKHGNGQKLRKFQKGGNLYRPPSIPVGFTTRSENNSIRKIKSVPWYAVLKGNTTKAVLTSRESNPRMDVASPEHKPLELQGLFQGFHLIYLKYQAPFKWGGSRTIKKVFSSQTCDAAFAGRTMEPEAKISSACPQCHELSKAVVAFSAH